jgi:UDP-N-acetyl-D-galactosamine dehydrogenase
MTKIAIIGLGYVGLPLAIEFSKHYEVVGFDISEKRIEELARGVDRTREIVTSQLTSSRMIFTSDPHLLRDSNIYIVTVPTPITIHKQPDLTHLLKASEIVGKLLKKNDIVIYESTVYPGCTEEDCVPVLEKNSGLIFNKDFYCGYSPERINPGDKERTLTKIVKVTSGSTPDIADKVNHLYASVITAGTFKASSIRVAEAAKIIENSQRDINIAFVNELSLIFHRMNLDTNEVLEAAGTKWNFVKFVPGLVGGHCIGVDPYYLNHKAQALGYRPEIILSGRRINDAMGSYVANQVVKLMIKKNQQIKEAKVLVLGMTFKENCSDIRNSRVADIVAEMKEFGCEVEIYDPLADPKEVEQEYQLELKSPDVLKRLENYSAIILAVPHEQFKELDVKKIKNPQTVFYDLKGLFPKELSDGRL